MSSSLRVNTIVPSTGTNVAIGTANGTVTFTDSVNFVLGIGSSIFSPASNTLTFGTNDAERLRITSAGKIGINTASPRAVLDIEGNAENATLMLHSNDANANLQFSDNTGGARILNYGGALAFRTGTNAHVFGTGDSEALRITSDGNIGIGNINPGDFRAGAENLVVGSGSGPEGMTIYSATNASGRICFADGSGASDEERGVIQYAHDDNHMQFDTNATERLRISSIGHLTTQGNNQGNPVGMELRNNNTNAYSHAELALTSQNATTSKIWCDVPNASLRLNYNGGTSVKINQSGNLVMANGAGIDFSATANSSGSMASELLDDYEEGTFTPSWGDSNSSYSSPSPTYSSQTGHYTKVGNTVYFDFYLATSNWNGSGSTMWVHGMPYAARNSGGYQQAISGNFCIQGVNDTGTINTLTGQIQPGVSLIQLYYQTSSSGNNYNTFSTGSVAETTNVTIRFNGFYFIS